jgi:outer membrane protein TolC
VDSTGSLQLTLKEAVQLSLKQNPQRIIAQLLVSESDRNSQIARSALLPQASIAASSSLNQYNLNSVEATPPRKAAGPYQFVEAGPTFSRRRGTHKAGRTACGGNSPPGGSANRQGGKVRSR